MQYVLFLMNEVIETSGSLHFLWPQNKRLHSPRATDRQHTRQDRWVQNELAFTPAKNATKPNPFKIIPLQPTRKENNWETEKTMERATVTLETERAKWPNPRCLWWWWWRIAFQRQQWLRDCASLLLHTYIVVLLVFSLLLRETSHWTWPGIGTFWHVYVLGPAYFIYDLGNLAYRTVPYVTSHRGHCPLLIRVSCITWRISKLFETLSFIRVT
jgi:hypothetical protein